MLKRITVAMVFCTALFAVSGLAEQPGQSSVESPVEILGVEAGSRLCAVPERSESSESKSAGIASVCTADCQYGSDKTCYGTSCKAVDQSCPGTRGYCWSNTTGYQYCDPCPCYAAADCQGSPPVFCQGSWGCFAIDNCYASCDGEYYMCPNPGPGCPY